MRINLFNTRKQVLMEDIEKLRLEHVKLIQEKDKIYNDIAEQRRGKGIVIAEKDKISKIIEGLNSLYYSTLEMAKKESKNFLQFSIKQKEQILELTKKINENVNLLGEYEEKKKTIIDIDSVNSKYTKQIQKLILEKDKLEKELKQTQKDINKFKEYMEKEKEEINKIKKHQEEVNKSLKIKESKLNRKEKLLLKMEKEIRNNL